MRWAPGRRQAAGPVGAQREVVVTVGAVSLDLAARRAMVRGHVIHLPAREAALLHLLMCRPGRVLAADELRSVGEPVQLRRLFRRLARRLTVDLLAPPPVERVGDSGYRLTAIGW